MYILTPLVTFAEAKWEVNKLVFEFPRDGKGYNIKVRLRDSKEGGLRMIDTNMFNKSLKAGRLKGYPLALVIPSENTLVFWVSLVIYIKSNRNSISLLCISLH